MRTEYKAGDLLTRDDIGLVFKDRISREWRIIDIHHNCVLIKNKDLEFIIHDNGYYDVEEFFESDYDLVSFVGASFTDEIKDKTITEKEYLKDKLETLESKIDFILAKLDSITRDMIIIHHDIQRGI